METEMVPTILDAAAGSATGTHYSLMKTLVAGGVAGVVVDVVLFPIDTVKTRLQSELGFWRAGGFRGIYKGLAPAAAGSAPTAALFFCAYESCKKYLSVLTGTTGSPYVHMASASCAEVLACLIRVPVEIAKQRRQTLLASKQQLTALQILWQAYKTEGVRRGLYRGYTSTIMREIPFSFIQFPLWEFLKSQWTPFTGYESTPFTVALCGAVSGGIAAGLTTPLDVAKTRIMLADRETKKLHARHVLSAIYQERGLSGLFAGFVPRVLWITLGGAFFFGFYDLTTRLLSGHTNTIDANNI